MKQAKVRNKEKSDVIRVNIEPSLIGINKTYFVKTYGCQMNEHDSENIRAILENMGYTEAEDIYTADIAILNSCAVRENAHNKVYGMLGRLKHAKESRKFIIGLCGCMPQEESVANEMLEKHRYVDLVFGTHNINKLPGLLDEAFKKQKIEIFSKEGSVIENLPVKRDSNIKASVNIMYGCDNFCTYCIIPFTRGAQRSRVKEDIILEIKELIKEGYQEITLLGQNVNAYAKDLDNDYSFSDLLAEISNLNILRVRFLTSHPWDFTDEMIGVIKKSKNIVPHIHLPVQAGSNKILKLMGRKYTKEEYLLLIKKIRNSIKDVAITTDIIVGFPGETKKDFLETISLVKKCEFDLAYTFLYSKRSGTPAALLEDDVSKEQKTERLKKLNVLVNSLALKNNEKYLGKKVKVLIENINPKNNELISGYTDTFKLVNLVGDKEKIGKVITVKITEAKSFSLNGEEV